MGLDADWLARISNARAVTLTNPDDPTQTTVNTARLLAAVSDVQGEFRLWAGVTYTETLPEHVALGVRGVTIYLRQYQGQSEQDELDAWRQSLRAMMQQLAWIPPTGTSNLSPTADVSISGQPALPDFDDARLRNYRPRPGGTGGGGGAIFGNG